MVSGNGETRFPGLGVAFPATDSLSRWSLKGTLYSQFDKLVALIEIHLDGNNLTGMIPEFNSLSNLEVLDLSKNWLTGAIPDFASLKKLQILNLESNRLSGTIPATLNTLSGLKELYLANNQLEGEIPPSLLAKFKAGTLNFTSSKCARFGGGGNKVPK
ncbi:hypothetical protein L7F22_053322 [Adiantum nelumboides]|nr:hypothetical protein [Adiantum nelumboides]